MAGIVQYVPRHSPKQTEIVDDLRRRIFAGELRPGSETPSLLELAQRHNASTRTVQSAMHHLRRLGYIQSVRGVGSHVSEAPPHLCNFALALPNVTQSFYKGLYVEAATISRDSESDGLPRRISSFRLDVGHGPGDEYVKLVADVQAHAVAGIIFAAPVGAFLNTPIFKEPGIPCAAILKEPLDGIAAIRQEDFLVKALDFLVQEGRHRVGFICNGYLNASEQLNRLWQQADVRGMKTRRRWIQAVCLDKPAWAVNCTEVLLCDSERPDALVIMDDNLVPAATAGVASVGLRVPDDLLVIAHTNFPYPTPAAVPVKRIGCDIRRILTDSIEYILNKRQGVPTQEVIPIPAVFEDELT